MGLYKAVSKAYMCTWKCVHVQICMWICVREVVGWQKRGWLTGRVAWIFLFFASLGRVSLRIKTLMCLVLYKVSTSLCLRYCPPPRCISSQTSKCVCTCGQVAFVLSPQAGIHMSASRVELIQVTNAPRGETLFTVATQRANNHPQLESSRELNSQEIDPLT